MAKARPKTPAASAAEKDEKAAEQLTAAALAAEAEAAAAAAAAACPYLLSFDALNRIFGSTCAISASGTTAPTEEAEADPPAPAAAAQVKTTAQKFLLLQQALGVQHFDANPCSTTVTASSTTKADAVHCGGRALRRVHVGDVLPPLGRVPVRLPPRATKRHARDGPGRRDAVPAAAAGARDATAAAGRVTGREQTTTKSPYAVDVDVLERVDRAVQDDERADDLRRADREAAREEDRERSGRGEARARRDRVRYSRLRVVHKVRHVCAVGLLRVHELQRRQVVRHVRQVAGHHTGHETRQRVVDRRARRERDALLKVVRELVETDAEDHFAEAARHEAAHPSRRQRLRVHVTGVERLEHATHGRHDDTGRDGFTETHQLRVVVRVRVDVLLRQVADALEAVDVHHTRRDLHAHVREERRHGLTGQARVEQRVHGASVETLERRGGRNSEVRRRLGVLLEERRLQQRRLATDLLAQTDDHLTRRVAVVEHFRERVRLQRVALHGRDASAAHGRRVLRERVVRADRHALVRRAQRVHLSIDDLAALDAALSDHEQLRLRLALVVHDRALWVRHGARLGADLAQRRLRALREDATGARELDALVAAAAHAVQCGRNVEIRALRERLFLGVLFVARAAGGG